MTALERLLNAIVRRRTLAAAGRTAAVTSLIAGGSAALAVTGLRLSGVADLAWSPLALAIPAVIALGAGLLAARGGDRVAAARLADRHLASDDLLRTALTVPGDGFGAVVHARAAERAASADPRRIVPWRPWRHAACALLAAFVTVSVWFAVPVRDPFGLRQERVRLGQRQAQLAQAKQRAAELLARQPDAANSPAVEAELARLLTTFQNLDPAKPAATAAALQDSQRQLGAAFAQAKAAALNAQDAVALGASDEAQRLRSALAAGESAALSDAVDKARELADQLAASSDPGEARKLHNELKSRLQDLAAAAQGKEAAAALQQALDQLAQASDPAAAAAAMAALADQLDLAQLQLQGLGQNARDAEALREALKAIQGARQAAQDGKLPGAKADSLAAYAKLFAEAMAGKGKGSGKGNGMGNGEGNGQTRPENDQAQTDFTSERSPAALTAGQIIMQWSAAGPSERGAVDERYRASLGTVKQAVSEALAKERLPPAQEEAVKRYFNDVK
jgi:hypothetical protein